MVARLWGTANGMPVIFSRIEETDQWSVAVPDTGNGTWVLALWAEDYAGNVGYLATVRMLYSAKNLRWEAEVLDVGAGVTEDEVLHLFGFQQMQAEVAQGDLHWRTEVENIGEEADG